MQTDRPNTKEVVCCVVLCDYSLDLPPSTERLASALLLSPRVCEMSRVLTQVFLFLHSFGLISL